jgi:hypothetical protein
MPQQINCPNLKPKKESASSRSLLVQLEQQVTVLLQWHHIVKSAEICSSLISSRPLSSLPSSLALRPIIDHIMCQLCYARAPIASRPPSSESGFKPSLRVKIGFLRVEKCPNGVVDTSKVGSILPSSFSPGRMSRSRAISFFIRSQHCLLLGTLPSENLLIKIEKFSFVMGYLIPVKKFFGVYYKLPTPLLPRERKKRRYLLRKERWEEDKELYELWLWMVKRWQGGIWDVEQVSHFSATGVYALIE